MKINVLIRLQKNMLKEAGGLLIIKKAAQLFSVICMLPLVLIIRIISPVYRVRIGKLTSGRIGHFAFDAGFIVANKCYVNNKKRKGVDLYWYSRPTANDQMDIMIRRSLNVNVLFKYIYYANLLVPGAMLNIAKVPHQINKSRDINGVLEKTRNNPEAYIKFNSVENELAVKLLEKSGWKKGSPFVCLIVRDQKYLDVHHPKNDWSKWDVRNSDINTYSEAIIGLAERGCWVFRMGKEIEHPLRVKHPRVLDYASSNLRCDLLDIWMMSHAHFCISTLLGLDNVASIYRVPVLFANVFPVQDVSVWTQSIIAPKLVYNKKDNSLVSLKNLVKKEILYKSSLDDYELYIASLSQRQVYEAVIEMLDAVEGVIQYSDNDNKMQRVFWELMELAPDKKDRFVYVHEKTRISRSYLNKYSDYLCG